MRRFSFTDRLSIIEGGGSRVGHRLLGSLALFLLASLLAIPARAACTNPAGGAGDMLYNSEYRVVQYCDDTKWVAAGPVVDPNPPADITSGLVGWWKLDEGSGTNAADSSGGGYDGTLYTGTSWSATGAPLGGVALQFDGANGDVGIDSDPAALNITSSFTISGWAKWTSFQSGGQDEAIFGKVDTDNTGYVLKGSEDCGQQNLVLSVANATGSRAERCGATTLSTGVWYYVTGVYDSSVPSMKVYINGVDDTGAMCSGCETQTIPSAVTPATAVVPEIGQFGVDGAGNFPGLLSDIRVYSRALSAGEVLQLYEANGGWTPFTSGIAIDLGRSHICAVKSGGGLYCSGPNDDGQIGDGTQTGRDVMTANIQPGPWIDVGTGFFHSCGIKADGSAWCWGLEDEGYMGTGGDSGLSVDPAPVSGSGSWTALDAGWDHTCGIKSDDTLWCWGNGTSGKLGDGAATDNMVPAQVSGGGSWKATSGGGAHNCAIKSDDTLWCWGSDGSGQLGNGATTGNQNTPQAIGSGTWKVISAGVDHTCGIKSDDTLWCWGEGDNGRLGNSGYAGDQIDPVPVSGGALWKAVGAGVSHTCAIKMDDTLWCWGSDSNGQLGNGATTGDQADPVQESTGASWKAVTAGDEYPEGTSCAVRHDNTLHCWGYGGNGQTALGGWASATLPTEVAGGGAWGFGICDSPAGAPGDIIYNAASNVMQYCDGTGWKGMAGKPPPSYVINGVTFDGTNDYLSLAVNFTGVADGKRMAGSFWVRRNALGQQTIYKGNSTGTTPTDRVLIEFDGSDKLHILTYAQAASTITFEVVSNTTFNDAGWHHVMFSIDHNVAGCTTTKLYIDGVADTATPTTCLTSSNTDFAFVATRSNTIGAGNGGASKFNGDLADFWLDIGVGGATLDLTNAATRAMFISGGAAVYLGADGSTPTGSAVDILLSGATASWHTNDAAGGGLTLNGALTDAATEPSSTGSPPCTGSGTLTEVGSYDNPGSAEGIWVDDDGYIYVAEGTSGTQVFSFDGTAFTLIDTEDPAGSAHDFWSDGTYIYLANESTLKAYTFNGSNLAEAGSIAISGPSTARDVWGDGTYIYVAADYTLLAYTFNGATFTQAGIYNGTQDDFQAVWSDGTYVYSAAGNGVKLSAWSFSAPTFTLIDSDGFADGWDIWGDGTYIYVSDRGGSGAVGYTFNGTTLTQAIAPHVSALGEFGIWGDGTNVFFTDYNIGFGAFTHNGSSFNTQVSFVDTTGNALDVWGDGRYVYVADGTFIRAYGGFEACKCTAPAGEAGDLMYNGANDVMQYCNGFQWTGIGK